MNHLETRLYTDEQYQRIGMLDAWHILLDAHNGLLYGFIENRLPEPGKAIDVSEAETHISHIEKEWEAERKARDFTNQWTGAPDITSMPLNAKLYLHSVLPEKSAYEATCSQADNNCPQPKEKPGFFRRLMMKWMGRDYNSD